MSTANTTIQGERIEQQSIQLLLADRFFGPSLLSLSVIETKPGEMAMPTACTDGQSLRYDPKFMESLNDAQVRYVLAEEAGHNMLGHPWRLPFMDNPDLCNQAADYELHGIMRQEVERCRTAGKPPPYEPPGGALDNPRFDGMSAEQIYAELLNKPKPPGGGGGGKGGGKSPPPGARPGEFEAPKVAPGQSKKLRDDWQKRLVQAKQMGCLPAGLERMVDRLLNPKVPWQEKLAHLIRITAHDNYNWLKPNKGYLACGLWLPSLHSLKMGTAISAQDTSGSMSSESLMRGTTEVTSLLLEARPETLIHANIDADIHSWHEYHAGDHISLECKGGGGSDMRPLFDRIAREGIEPVVVVVITDLCIQLPSNPPDYPVIWLTEEDAIAPWGETIKMDK